MIKKLFLFGSLITSLLASSLIPGQEEDGGVMLKSMTGKDDIMNLDSVFNEKAVSGKGKEKERKKKPKKRDSSSSSDEDDKTIRRSRTSRPTLTNPGTEQVIRQQEVVVGGGGGGNRHGRHTSKEDNVEEENVITVTGPIRRKPLFHT